MHGRGIGFVDQLCADEVVELERRVDREIGALLELVSLNVRCGKAFVGAGYNGNETIGGEGAAFLVEERSKDTEVDARKVAAQTHGEDSAVGGMEDMTIGFFVDVFDDIEDHRFVGCLCGAVRQDVGKIAVA